VLAVVLILGVILVTVHATGAGGPDAVHVGQIAGGAVDVVDLLPGCGDHLGDMRAVQVNV
jgi:hypothetical protein